MWLPFVLLHSIVLVAAAPEVKLGNTTLIGRDVTLLQQDFFGAIPFAEPPVGPLRLQRPVLKTSINATTFDASDFGPACFQTNLSTNSMSEDCLTINVFRPSGLPSNASLPVLFWTFGGGFQDGAAFKYNGSAIVAQSVARGTPLIYVNYNYRLGPLGFPQGQEADQRGALNLALRDQLTALEWVQENIGAFGGDKTKVTIFGESAGAIMSAVLFLNSPLPQLARAAIFESGSAATSLVFNAERRDNDWENFVEGVAGCESLAKTDYTFSCLQNANSSSILNGIIAAAAKAQEQYPWSPTLDGPNGLYPDLPSRLFQRGQFARLPFITGTNLDEGTIFIPQNVNYTTDVIESFLVANMSPPAVSSALFDEGIDKILELYPDVPALGSPFNTGNETFGLSPGYKRASAIQGDLGFQSQRRLWIQTAAKAGVKTFGYLFTQTPIDANLSTGVSHGSEVVFVYGDVFNASASAQNLSAMMIDYWVSFATSLDPNDGKGLSRPNWEQYTPQNEVIMQLNGDNTTLIPDNYRAEQIDFINSEPLVFRHRRAV